MEATKLILTFFFCFATLIPSLWAHIADFDEVWQKRAEEAAKAALEAYQPNPEQITDDFNLSVQKATEGTNSTRRNLRKYTGPCRATNPIDRCWRCRNDWAKNRKRLAKCALGFGRKTTGGKKGRYYIVTDASDDNVANPKPGTLRHAVIQKGPLWIYFAKSMIIRLSQELLITSHKTIDGRGAYVRIADGAGLNLQFVKNVIIHGLHIHNIVTKPGGLVRDSVDHLGFRTVSDGDGISVFGSTNIWIDHMSMSNCQDGLIDVIEGSTAVTISNSHFTKHNDVMLLGGNDQRVGDKVMQVTVAFNHFGKGLIQRMPRCRLGFFHVVNNDYTHWIMYAIGGSANPTIISQGNRFIAPANTAAKEVTKREYTPEGVWKNWIWRSENDLLMDGAFFIESGDPKMVRKFSRLDMIKAKPGAFVGRLTRFSGAITCKEGKPC